MRTRPNLGTINVGYGANYPRFNNYLDVMDEIGRYSSRPDGVAPQDRYMTYLFECYDLLKPVVDTNVDWSMLDVY
jgi:hypothetical protein